MAKRFITVAIDGQAASGKSSLARALSKRLELLHVDTGLQYRLLTAILLEASIGHGENEAVARFLRGVELLPSVKEGALRIQLATAGFGEVDLRSEAVNKAVGWYARLEPLRACLLPFQRNSARIAKEAGFEGVVMEGRDIGSVVLPQADYKFFLKASAREREKRRRIEGQLDAIYQRDRLDTERAVAPLRQAADAVTVDTSSISLERVVEKVSCVLRGRKKGMSWKDWWMRHLGCFVCGAYWSLGHGANMEDPLCGKKGPFLIVSNHLSYGDPTIFGSLLPIDTYYMTSLPDVPLPLIGKFNDCYNKITVARDGRDVRALREAVRVLREGHHLFIFPEGKRAESEAVEPFMKGLGFIACQTGAQVLPIKSFGMRRIWGRGVFPPRGVGNLTLAIGEPIGPESYDSGKTDRKRYEKATLYVENVMRKLKAPDFPAI